MNEYKFERRVALFVAVAIVGTVLYLVVRNNPFADPNLAGRIAKSGITTKAENP